MNNQTSSLSGVRIAILATDGFGESELTKPLEVLKNAGAKVDIVSPESGSVRSFQHDKPGETISVDVTLANADASDYDGLVIPGGLFNPDALRTNDEALAFTRAFFEAGKPVGAICHGPQVLISADLVKGRTMTAVKAVQKDLENAGAKVVDEEVVVDQGLVTSRTPDDLEAFCDKLVEEFGEGKHRGQATKTASAAA